MERKVGRKICGTCAYWNGSRELLPNKNKVAILEETGICQCPISSKSGEIRKKDLNCKCYENFSNQLVINRRNINMSKAKIISFFIVITSVLLMLSSCNSYQEDTKETKTPTQNVIDEISQLSEYSSIEQIKQVQELYDSLLISEKEQISNYEHFLYCKECVEYKDIVNRALDLAEKDLASRLKNPQSLQVNSRGYYAYKYSETTNPRIVYICTVIDYSAQNGFGGYNRNNDYVVYEVSFEGELEKSRIYDGYWELDYYDRYDPPYEK